MKTSEIRIAASPLSGHVYAGKISEDETHWVGDKKDVHEDFKNIVLWRIEAIQKEMRENRSQEFLEGANFVITKMMVTL